MRTVYLGMNLLNRLLSQYRLGASKAKILINNSARMLRR